MGLPEDFDQQAWDQQNAGKIQWGDPNVPLWQKMGLGSQADYNRIYGATQATPGSPGAGQPIPNLSDNPNAYSYSNNDAFGQYLNANPQAATASGYISSYLKSLNLESLTPFVQNLILNGTTDANIIQQKLYETPEFKAEYPEVAARLAAGKTPLSPADVINNRAAYAQALQKNGVNPSYVTPQQMSQWMIDDVSPTEVDSRLSTTVAKISTDPTLAPQLQRLYGIGVSPGEVAAHFLDPEVAQPYLEKQFSAADIAARAQGAGFGQLNLSQSESLAGLGITDAQATSGFGTLAMEKGLLDPTASENNSISADTAIAAQFQNNADAQRQLQQRLLSRRAGFSGGGNFADPNKQGTTGAGGSNT